MRATVHPVLNHVDGRPASTPRLSRLMAPLRPRRHSRGGVVAAVAVALSCAATKVLLITGVATAGSGLLGSPELTALAVLVPALLLGWKSVGAARRRRRRHS